MTTATTNIPGDPPSAGSYLRQGKRPRDLRLDFFRGLAMFIILLAHTPGNTWTLWIPARFGFSDATEIFVFCSGMASAIAFGSVFAKKSWFLGSARIVFRVWQVYWAHIGVFLFTAIMLFAIDHYGWGLETKSYIRAPYVVPLFNETGEALIGLFTLTYVPGLFDILPMYLVILGMIPMVMAIHRFAGKEAVFAAVLGVWLAAQLAGYARLIGKEDNPADWQAMIAALGEPFLWMNLPSSPWRETGTWFFNPFGWQLVFFTGFAFGMKWLPAPPVRRWLIWTAAIYVLATIPFAWFKIHQGHYLPDAWLIQDWIEDTRNFIEPLRWKSWVGGLRYLHYLAVAYLAWVAVGPGGDRLREGFPVFRAAGGWVLIGAGAVFVGTAPYAYVDEIKYFFPALDAWLMEIVPIVPGARMGLVQIAHLIALVILIWAAIGSRARAWVTGPGFLKTVPVIRKVGTQSLAVFMVSIPLARFNGLLMDLIGRDVWTRLAVNAFGFAVLIAVAYAVSWFKGHPWRREPKRSANVRSEAAAARAEGRTGDISAPRNVPAQ